MTIKSLVESLIGLINVALPALASIAVLLFLWGVFTYFRRRAEGRTRQSTDTIVWGLVALFVIFFLGAILQAIKVAFLE